MANTSNLPNPETGKLEVYKISPETSIPNTIGEEHANPVTGLELGSSPITSPSP